MFSDIPHSRPNHTAEDEAAVCAVLQSQMTAAGSLAQQLAEMLRLACLGEYASATASGTLALLAALQALGVRQGQAVILPTYVCAEVLDAIYYLKARPVLCDIDPCTFAPSAATVAAVRTPQVRAVIVPHLFGIPAGIEDIVKLGLPVVEDLAQGLGAEGNGRAAGTWGAASVLSFKAIKLLSSGEGGAVVMRDPEAAERLKNLHARRDPSQASFNFPLSDMAAGLALSQWRRLPGYIQRRRLLARQYLESLVDLTGRGLGLPSDFPGRAWFRFPLALPPGVRPLDIRRVMARSGIQVRQPVDALLHRRLGLLASSFPVAEKIFARTLSLPLYPSLQAGEQDKIIRVFRQALNEIIAANYLDEMEIESG